MAAVVKINANDSGLSWAEETSIKVLPGTPVWFQVQPNQVRDFGGNVSKTAREFIVPDRQRRKGQTTDLDSAGSFNHDLVQEGLQSLFQGFMFSSFREKVNTVVVTSIDGTLDDYVAAADMDDFAAGDLVFATGFDLAANNGLKRVTAVTTTLLSVAESLTTDASPAAGHKIYQVGFQFVANDAVMDVASGDLPRLVSAAKTMTDFGLVPGEYIYIGGDTTPTKFTDAANAGFCRVRSVAATYIELDKAPATLIAEVLSGGETLQIFFGRVLKNETGTNIVRRTYNLERTLGAPDDALPANIQSEYVTGAVPSEVAINIPVSDIAKVDMTWMGLDHETRTGVVGVKSGTRAALTEEEAYNTSSNVPRIKLAIVNTTDEAPTALFAFVEEITITIDNNISVDKAVGTLGGFDATTGTFMVTGTIQAYFADVASIAAVRDNSDVTLEMHMVRDNKGMTWDLPLLSLGDGRLTIEKDETVMLPLNHDASTGAGVVSTLDHTLLMVFWDYLPDAAE